MGQGLLALQVGSFPIDPHFPFFRRVLDGVWPRRLWTFPFALRRLWTRTDYYHWNPSLLTFFFKPCARGGRASVRERDARTVAQPRCPIQPLIAMRGGSYPSICGGCLRRAGILATVFEVYGLIDLVCVRRPRVLCVACSFVLPSKHILRPRRWENVAVGSHCAVKFDCWVVQQVYPEVVKRLACGVTQFFGDLF